MRWSVVLVRHARQVVRGGQLRFRLETFGLYYPAAPYRRRPWQISVRTLWLLVRQALSYAGWVRDMEEIRDSGSTGWWRRRGGPPGEPPPQ